MSTATVDQNVTSALDTTSEVVTQARIAYQTGVDKEGNPEYERKVVSEEVAAKVEKDGKYEGKDAIVEGTQSFITYKANTIDGISQLIPDDNEVVAMFNRGIATKQGNKIRTLLMQTDNGEFGFEFKGQPYDLKADLAVPTNRRLSPLEKIVGSVNELPPEQLKALLSLLAAKSND